MKPDDAKQLFEALFVVYPAFRNWLNETKVPRETLAAWCEMLADVEYEHGTEAVHRLREGKLKMPAAYERDQLPVLLRSYSLRIAQDQAKDQADEKLAAETRKRRRAQSNSPWRYNLGTILDEAREAGRRLRDGEITAAENKRIVDELRRKARETKSTAVEAARIEYQEMEPQE